MCYHPGLDDQFRHRPDTGSLEISGLQRPNVLLESELSKLGDLLLFRDRMQS
jgi:hypothetical protein